MNLNFTDEETRDIEKVVNSLSTTKEDYFLSLHKRNAITKEALQDSQNLRFFIEDYHHMLDNLYDYNFALKDMIENNNDTKVIDAILYFLDNTFKDPMVLTQLYTIYEKQNEKDLPL